MNDGLFKVFEQHRYHLNLTLDIGYSRICDWHITITVGKRENEVISFQECDLSLLLARAEVELKIWLSENNGGY